MEQVRTVVVGAGQAGLSASRLLSDRGIEHVVLERGEVANTWRTARWDGFTLNTPNWTLRLPGHEYGGPEPEAFSPLAGVIAYLDDYARTAPVRTSAEVTRLRPYDGGWRVTAGGDEWRCESVVVATGPFQRPFVPAAAADAPVEQLVADRYRNPEQLPPGAVLVVGSGQTGCQIADELRLAGREVYLAVGACPWFPRRFAGRDLMHWALGVGLMDDTVDTLPAPGARFACNPAVSGDDGGHDLHPRWLAARGVGLVGRFVGFDGGRALFAPGLEATLARGDEFFRNLIARFEAHARAEGIDVPDAETPAPAAPAEDVESLDLRERGIGSIVWATGYRPDFGWIEGARFDEQGFPLHSRGVAEARGLYFVGLHWLHKRKSALLVGVGDDAAHVVDALA